jgi:hypothetical protein
VGIGRLFDGILAVCVVNHPILGFKGVILG